jgi:hypothetical protein
MPKETVHDEAQMYDVQVGWTRDRDVQIGVETSDKKSIANHLIYPDVQKWIEAERAKFSEDRLNNKTVGKWLTDGEIGVAVLSARYTGLWSTLDREGCNQLIRLLRRARDQAFGADA